MTSSPTNFHQAVSLEPSGPGADHSSRWRGSISDQWMVGFGANGGYQAGLLANAAMLSAGDEVRRLRSIVVHYLLPTQPGPFEISVDVLRSGRSASVLDLGLHSEGRLTVAARAVVAAARPSPAFTHRTAPQFPDPLSLGREVVTKPQTVRARYDTRYVMGGAPPQQQATAQSSGWCRTEDAAPVDLALLVAICDGWAPPVMMLEGPPMLAATIDLTVHLFDPLQEPYDDWVAVTNESNVANDGYVNTETEVWTRDGRLLAQARQISAYLPWDPDA